MTISRDVIDVPVTAMIADLPGPDGKISFNEALIASDNTPGRQTVGFAIPEEEWWLSEIFPGQVLLQSSFGWSARESVIIDGTTQTAFTGDTFPGGHEMSLDGLDLELEGDNSEIFGFHGCHVGLSGNDSVIHDNSGKMDIDIGPFNSGNVVRDNEADTIKITYSDNNVVIRNVADRVRITGQGNSGPPASGNVLGGPNPGDRNFITGWGNVGEHGSVNGDTVELFYTDNTLIENNYIGTTPDGMSIGNYASTVGVGVYNSNSNLTIHNNLIAIQAHSGGGSTGDALGSPIYLNLYEGGSNIKITGNTMGLNALGEPILGGDTGVNVNRDAFEYGADNVTIGGPDPGDGNIIAGHDRAGILMTNGPGITPVGYVRVSGNSIYNNGEIGIDLTPNTWTFGPTANDALDTDVGANGLQNYPEILMAANNGQEINIAGQLHSEPSGEFTLEFFASPVCDPSGFGQGQIFLGSTNVVTDAEGNAEFDVVLPAEIELGWVVSSTATLEPIGATSEFSACVEMTVTESETALPNSFSITTGNLVSGGLAELAESDNQYLVINPRFPNIHQLVFTVDATAATNTPGAVAFSLESNAVFVTDTATQKIELLNFDTGQYETIDERVPSSTDSIVTVTPGGDPARFVQPETAAMRARISYNKPPPTVRRSRTRRGQFRTSIDHIYWTVTQ